MPFYFDWINGSDSNDGLTPQTPKKSYEQFALSGQLGVLGWGQRFFFKRGAPQVFTAARGAKNGLPNFRTIYGAYGEAQIPYALFTGTFVAATNSCLIASGSQYITFEDIWFDKNGLSLNSAAGSDTIEPIVRRCRFTNMMGLAGGLSGVEISADLGSAYTVIRGVIEDCEVYDNGGHGIVASGVDGAIVRRNKVWNNGRTSANGAHGISVIPSRTTLVSTGWSGAGPVYSRALSGVEATLNAIAFIKNTTTNSVLARTAGAQNAPNAGEWGYDDVAKVIYINLGGVNPNTQTMSYVWRRATNVQVYGNEVASTQWQFGQSPYQEGAGIQLDDMADGCTVAGNYVHDNVGTGIVWNSGPNNVIAGNWIENNGRSGISGNGANALVVNNTVVRNMARDDMNAGDLGEITVGRPHSTGCRFLNNLVIGRRSGRDPAIQVYDVAASTTIAKTRAASVLELHTMGVGTVNDNQMMADVEKYLNGDRSLRTTIDIGGVPMRNPLDGAGVWVQGGRTFDGAPLIPGRVPIGARMPAGRMS